MGAEPSKLALAIRSDDKLLKSKQTLWSSMEANGLHPAGMDAVHFANRASANSEEPQPHEEQNRYRHSDKGTSQRQTMSPVYADEEKPHKEDHR